VNCLIGPGDSGKSTILDAIDLCLGARRNIQISDADFHNLDIDRPIQIAITLGDLDDALKNIDTYGVYLRGLNLETGELAPEPEVGLETVLTVRLTFEGDLEPQWTLVSERAAAQNVSRNLTWHDRAQISPTRLGAVTAHNLSWRRDSILNRVSEERADTSAALAKAAREARASFGEDAKDQLGETLKLVADTAKELGISVGDEVKALLDAHAVSFTGGTISLHDADGIPLKSLGLGSTRLLIAGLQRRSVSHASLILIDELEHGLEPHRIIRFLDALGAKEKEPPLQSFMTTHSPVAIRELSGDQLFVVRSLGDEHESRRVGTDDAIQGTIRRYPDALLAPSIIVCEGASEVGLLRGLDQYRIGQGERSITALGTALVDGGGTSTFVRANAFRALGYRTAVLRDSDAHATPELEKAFAEAGGTVFPWRDGRALEDELFLSLSVDGVKALLDKAVEIKEDSIVDEHIKSVSNNAKNLEAVEFDYLLDQITEETRAILGKAARVKNGWFKTVSDMQSVAAEIVGPHLGAAETGFTEAIDALFKWTADDEQ
jgi:putative ATP-dependent endonuclease of OLD family